VYNEFQVGDWECSLHSLCQRHRLHVYLFKIAQDAVQSFRPQSVYDSCVTSATVHTNCKDELQAQNRGWWYIVILSMPETAGVNRRGQNHRRLQDLNLRASRQ